MPSPSGAPEGAGGRNQAGRLVLTETGPSWSAPLAEAGPIVVTTGLEVTPWLSVLTFYIRAVSVPSPGPREEGQLPSGHLAQSLAGRTRGWDSKALPRLWLCSQPPPPSPLSQEFLGSSGRCCG